ncbi:S8 family serine peptidase [Caldisalinibacter kiritimatiensis]|uniref:Putative lactocepin n=1 Tax=Caldisalinibacter kiritimatiensis TaxID=1304284 RepID=R1AYL2_9FIRM|nr:S8 family serine peptidase [Caldisalinibacter kiritimatiensis]EOD01787.1 putative lactocepin [Caldisalinibacter kiritimatiensis]
MKGKRFLSIFLTLLLVLGTFSSVFAAPNKILPGTKTFKTPDVIEGNKLEQDPRAENLEDEEEVRIIVELNEDPIIKYATDRGVKVSELSSTTREQVADELLTIQRTVKENISNSNIDIVYHNSFVNVFNGFSGTTTFGDAKRIEKLPSVNRVYIANEYQRPEPDMNTSLDIVKARETWSELGYDGEGMVVAVLDTGIDPSHKDMVLSNRNKARLDRTIVDALIVSNSLPGKWFTEKVPYGYNYMDNNQEILDIGPDASMHGMHVAGTVGANGDPDNGGIKGVAPEAQLLAMKVFGNDPGMPSTFGDIIIRAIDDSVALGADVINMSLGSTSAFVMPDDPEQQAVTRAVENGVFVSISAGNSNHIGDGWDNPLAQNPDIGVVGSPGLTPESLQVASVENTHIKAEAFEYIDENDESHLVGYIAAGSYDPVEVFSGPVEYVYCGLGGIPENYEDEGLKPQDDFEGVDLEGKIALIKRGSFAFVDKIMNAQNHGAIGVIVFNHETGGESLINMMYPEDGLIPAVFIGHSDGSALLDLVDTGNNFIEFNGEQTTVLNPNSGKMSEFTSWGTTPNLDFKPEITAPGGNIYSTLNNNKYGIMSGTSMAAPHVSGGAALALQMVQDKFPHLSGRDKVEMAKNILMSTANPLPDKGLYNDYFGLGNYNFTSPRRHGAGVMNLYAATTTPAVVVDKDTGLSKVNLEEIDDYTTFTLTVDNFSNQTVTYAVYGTVQTDLVIDGVNQLETQGVYKADTIAPDGPNGFWSGEFPITFELDGTVIDNVYNLVEVPAGETVDFDVTIDLTDTADWFYNAPLEEIFPNGTFIEGFVRLVDVNDETPELSIPYIGFYGEWDEVPVIDESVYSDKISFYGITCMVDGEGYFLGQKPNEEFDDSKIAFSPNNDGWFDSANAVLSFLRNAREVDVNILDADGNKIRDLYYEEYVRKNYYDGGSGTFYNWKPEYEWDGKVNNEVVPDGEYIYEVRTKVDYENADWQTLKFPVIVDTVAPVIESVDYSEENNTITVTATDTGSTIREYYLMENGEIFATSDNGVFDLANDNSPHVFTVIVADYAGNETVHNEQLVFNVNDDTIPYIMLESPEAFGTYNVNEILVKGYVVESTGIKELRINDQIVDTVYNNETGNFEFETTLVLEDGMNIIDVTGIDLADNEINFERKIFVDTTAPVISITNKPSSVVNKNVESINISANITDNLPDLLVKVNGNVLANIQQDWSYFEDLPPAEFVIDNYNIDLEFGNNEIVIEAQDAAGNKTVKEYNVVRKEKSSSSSGSSSSKSSSRSSRETDENVVEDTITTKGGEISSSDNDVQLKFEAETFDENVDITVTLLEDNEDIEPKKTSNIVRITDIYEFDSESEEFNKPVKVEFKYDEDKLEDIDEELLGVYTFNEETNQWEYVGGKVDKENNKVIAELNHFSKYTVMASTRTFDDMVNHWAEHEVKVAAARGIIDGVDGINYAPERNMTRAEFVKVLVCTLGLEEKPYSETFTDTNEAWFTGYIEAAVDAGLISTEKTEFRPNEAITREEMATMVTAALEYKAPDKAVGTELTFEDKDEISEEALEAVAIAYNNGIIKGMTETTFAPKANATRAHAAVMIYRMLETLDLL